MTTVSEAANKQPKRRAPPIDHGYAWVVCAACFVIFFVAIGINKSMGLFLVILQERYQADPVITVLTVSIAAGGIFCFVSMANGLGLMFGFRQVACMGSLLMSFSMIGTAYAPNIYTITITLGLLSGVGTSAIFGPPMVVLSMYFNKRRALATGIAMTGGSVGTMIIPQLLKVTLDEYGYSGSLLILTGVMLQSLPATLLLRPMTFFTQKRLKPVGGASAPQAPPKPNMKMVCTRMWDKELLHNKMFGVFLLSMILAQCAYLSSILFMPTIFRRLFNNPSLAFLVPTILGASDLVGRLGFGVLADVKAIPKNYILGLSLILPGGIAIVSYLFVSVGLMMVSVVAIGILAGAYLPLLSPMTIHYFGLAKVGAGFGLCTFFMGVFLIPLPLAMTELGKAAGVLNVFLMAAILLLVAGSVAMTLDVVRKASLRSGSQLPAPTPQPTAAVVCNDDSSSSETDKPYGNVRDTRMPNIELKLDHVNVTMLNSDRL